MEFIAEARRCIVEVSRPLWNQLVRPTSTVTPVSRWLWNLCGFTLCLVAISGGTALADAPTLTHLFPAGGQRGAKVAVTCAGKFTWPVKVWAPGVGINLLEESGKIELTIPADLPADRIWIRLYSAEGASTLLPFLIGSSPEIAETEPNDHFRTAQAVTGDQVIVNGALKEGDVDSFAVELKAGQVLVAALDANTRIGSPIDSILQVTTAEGIIVAENHDDLNLDPRLAFKAPKDGKYIVRTFGFPSTPNTTIRFHGGADNIYRLMLATGPFVTQTLPLCAPLTEANAVTGIGWNCPVDLKLDVHPWGGPTLVEQKEFEPLEDLRRPSDARIGLAHTPDFKSLARVRLTSLPIVMAAEHQAGSPPQVIPTSAAVTGRIQSHRQTDEYQVALVKGQQYVITAESRSLDIPFDLTLKLIDPNGTVVADIDDSGPSRDALIVHAAAHDGNYRIQVTDRFRQGSDRSWYLLSIRPDLADFDLSAGSDSIVVTAEKPAELAVKLARRGVGADVVGPITIDVIGLPDGITAASVVSETSGATAAEVKLQISSTGVAFSGPIRVRGKASTPKEIERLARTPVRLGVNFDTFWLTGVEKPKEAAAQ